MGHSFQSLFAEHLYEAVGVWVDEVYADRRTDLPRLLSFRELVEFVPEVCDELGALLDGQADDLEVTEAARRMRVLAQTRFQQGALLDEVARELMILRGVLADFVWREAPDSIDGGPESGVTMRLLHRFFDEIIAQAILVYAASMRPTFPTRDSVWPPPRRRHDRIK